MKSNTKIDAILKKLSKENREAMQEFFKNVYFAGYENGEKDVKRKFRDLINAASR